MNTFSRRSFLRASAGAGFAHTLTSFLNPVKLLAQASSASSYKALVCISLDGGCDGNNLLVPLSSSAYSVYARARTGLALPPNSLLTCDDGGREAYGFHPALANIRSLYNKGAAAVLANVGPLLQPVTAAEVKAGAPTVPTSLLDHERQRYEWGTSQTTANGSIATSSGWGGRIADAVASYNSGKLPMVMCLAPGMSEQVFCYGDASYPVVTAPGSAGAFPTDAASSLQLLAQTTSGNTLIGHAAAGLSDSLDQNRIISEILQASQGFTTVFPNSSLGAQLRQVLQMIQARGSLGMNRQIFHCVIQGFDNHENQVVLQGAALADLDASLGAFHSGLVELGLDQSVTTFTTSDFGRTLCQNATSGSDHAWGNHALIVGGGVRGGRIYGKYPDLTIGGMDDIGEGRWIPTTAVSQYGATLAAWFGVQPAALPNLFPHLNNFAKATLSFL